MSDPVEPGAYDNAIRDIQNATSLADLDRIADRYPATVTGENGALYSGWIGQYKTPGAITSDNLIAQIEARTDTPLINRTERGKFLSDKDVSAAIDAKAQDIFINDYHVAPAEAEKMANSYLFGSTEPGQTQLADSQWGRASAAYAQSLHGDVPVFATNANAGRIFGQVEFQTALNNPNVTSIGGVPVAELRDRVARDGGDVSGALETAQQSFRNDVAKGLFVGPGNQPVFSQEFADKYHMSGTFEPAEQLRRSGFTSPNIDAAAVPVRTGPVVPAEPPLDPAAPRPADAPAFTYRPSGQGLTSEGAAISGESGGLSLGSAIRGAGLAGTVALGAYDAYKTTQQYAALQANGNAFAANQYLRTQAIVTASSVGGSIAGAGAAGFAYGAAGGSETGPGAIVTGVVGGVIGGGIAAIGGEKYAEHLTQESVDHDRGTDGKTYQYDNGSWKTTHPVYEPWKGDSAAPASQVPTLDMERTEKLTDLAMAHPTTIDPSKIEARDPHTGETHTWQRAGSQAWTSSSHGTVTQASPELVAQLNQQSAMRTAMGTNSADVAAKGFVTDYYGNGWDKLAPMPQSVAHQLHLPSETQIKDPATGITWDVNGNNVSRLATPGEPAPAAAPTTSPVPAAARPEAVPPRATLAPTLATPEPSMTPAPEPAQGGTSVSHAPQPASPTPNPQPEQAPPQLVTATGATQARVLAARDQAVAANHAYGANLIQQQYDTMRATSPALAGNNQSVPGTNGASPRDLSSLGDAIQSRLDALRSAGVSLHDVRSVEAYTPRTQNGSFVQISDDVVAQHLGRGAYQVASVSQDLNGVTPPEGRNVTIDPRGQVADRQLQHSYQRMM